MKILQVFDFLSVPHGGGTVDIMYRLSRSLSKRGHEVEVCTGDFEIDRDYISGLNGIKVHMFKSLFNKGGMYVMPGLMGFDVVNYDVIHFHCLRSYQNAVLCGKAARHKVPYVIDAHGSTVYGKGTKKLVHLLFDKMYGNLIINHASRLIAETKTGVEEFLNIGADMNKIKIVHPGIDVEEFDELPDKGLFRSKYGLEDKFIILFVGRIHEAKGIDTLVEVLYLIRRKGINAHLVIVGQDDGFEIKLREKIADSGLSYSVTFTGFLSGKEKLSAMVDADMLVQPSKNEGGARPSVEALLCGTPVAVTKGTGAGDEIESFNGGFVFDYGNVMQLCNILKCIHDGCASSIDDMVLQAQKWIRNNLAFSIKVKDYEKVYNEVV